LGGRRGGGGGNKFKEEYGSIKIVITAAAMHKVINNRTMVPQFQKKANTRRGELRSLSSNLSIAKPPHC
jgi:hypothetical protein